MAEIRVGLLGGKQLPISLPESFGLVVSTYDAINHLLEMGWQEVYFARMPNLRTPLAEPEEEGRVFVVARK